MPLEKVDQPLQKTLDWALERMKGTGRPVRSRVTIVVDPSLAIMGYAREKDGVHYIVVADWALDSEMLGGLVLHELSHIYLTENGAPSHRPETINEVLERMREREGLSQREQDFLIDAFNHLQNILADDLIFALLSRREIELVQRFFAGWITERPLRSPLMDAFFLTRNAFAVASLKRRNLYDASGEMSSKNLAFLSQLGGKSQENFDSVERFLEEAKSEWNEEELRKALSSYLEMLLSLARGGEQLADFK